LRTKPFMLLFVLLSQFLALKGGLIDRYIVSSIQTNEVQVDWSFVLNSFGSANVTVLVGNVNDSALEFQLPRSYEGLKISLDINGTITEVNGSSYDLLTINNISASSLSFMFAWPDAAVQYRGAFYFAGQEKFEVGPCNITIWLPEKASVFWVEGSNLTGTYEKLSFERKRWELLPSFSYSFVDQPKLTMPLETSSHANLYCQPIMIGKPWINSTLDVIEQNWNWLKTILNGTIDSVDMAFAPYGYNDLGTKKDGICYYGKRNIEIVATKQFGVGLDGWCTALILHELSHAFTPLLEDLPSFYSEAIAEDLSYDALGRTSLNENAISLEESRFSNAYRDGVQGNLINYTWMWKWNDIIYDNYTITSACYGVSAFIGDYIIHHWGYASLDRLNALFNKTEMDSLNESQRFSRFVEYLNVACNGNISETLGNLAILINQWNDADHMRKESYTIAVIGPSTFYVNEKLGMLVKEANDHYNDRDYDLSISRFEEAKDLVDSDLWQWLDYAFWTLIALVVIVIIVLVRRRHWLRVSEEFKRRCKATSPDQSSFR